MIEHRADLLLAATEGYVKDLEQLIIGLEINGKVIDDQYRSDIRKYHNLPFWKKWFTPNPSDNPCHLLNSIRRDDKIRTLRNDIRKVHPLLQTLRFAVKQGYREVALPFEFYYILDYL